MKKSMSSLNVKKRFSIKALLFGCVFLCSTLISAHSVSAMFPGSENPDSLSPTENSAWEDYKKGHPNGLHLVTEKGKEKKCAEMWGQYKKSNPSASYFWIDERLDDRIVRPEFRVPASFDEYGIGDYPVELLNEKSRKICAKVNNELKKAEKICSNDSRNNRLSYWSNINLATYVELLNLEDEVLRFKDSDYENLAKDPHWNSFWDGHPFEHFVTKNDNSEADGYA